MIKPVKVKTEEVKTIPMCDMEPMTLGTIYEPTGSLKVYHGRVVLKSAGMETKEVLDLSEPGEGACWNGHGTIRVIPFKPGESVTLTEGE